MVGDRGVELAVVVLATRLAREVTLRFLVPVKQAALPGEGAVGRRGDADFLRELRPLLRADVVQLEGHAEDRSRAVAGDGREVAFAKLGVVPTPLRGDGRQRVAVEDVRAEVHGERRVIVERARFEVVIDAALLEIETGARGQGGGAWVAAAGARLEIGAAVAVAAVGLGDEQGLDRVADVVLKHGAQALALVAVDGLVVEDVEDVAVEFAADRGDAGAQRIAERAGNPGAQLVFVVLVEACADVAVEGLARALRGDVDDPGRCVFAEQRALRAAQHLDALEIVEIGEGLPGAAEHDAVDHGRDAGFGGDAERDRADAAHGQRAVAGRVAGAEADRGHQRL